MSNAPRPIGRRRRINVDASARDGFCGIAAILEDRDVRVLFMDVGASRGSVKDEWLALCKAMEIADKAGWTQVVFRTDATGMRKLFYAEQRPILWTLEVVPRAHNTAAHTVAGQALKLWEAGRDNRLTLEGEV